jgi:hypothetical protein
MPFSNQPQQHKVNAADSAVRVEITPADAIRSVLQKAKGVYLAESEHGAKGPLDLMRSLLPVLKEQGVTKLFVEQLDSKRLCCRVEDNVAALESTLKRKGWDWNSGAKAYALLMHEAAASGITVIGLDNGTKGVNRIATSPRSWQQVINGAERAGKFAIIAGKLHAGTYMNVPGADLLLGIPAITFKASSRGESPGVYKNSSRNHYLIVAPNH